VITHHMCLDHTHRDRSLANRKFCPERAISLSSLNCYTSNAMSENAIIYVRVSTDEQAEKKHNLETQQSKSEEHCAREGWRVVKIFVDAGASGRTTEGRPKFKEMMQYVRKNRGKVSRLVFADLSRLARNISDQSATLAMLRELGVIPISCDENIDDSAAGKLTTNLLGVVHQFSSDSLSERVKYRMKAGAQAGRWLYVAPIGYLNAQSEHNEPVLKVDEQRAQLIRKAFELVATRSYTLEEVLRRITVLGLTTRKNRTVTKQTLSRMLRNEIYAGWIIGSNVKVKGLHTPLISQELFDDVQRALKGEEGAARPIEHKKLNEDFPLKGFVLCAGCGKKLTAGWVRGRKDRYARYWCWNTKCATKVGASRDEVEGAFVQILGMMQPTEAYVRELPRVVKEYWAHRLERVTTERRTLSNRMSEIKTLNQKILLQKVNDEISAEDFAVLKENVTQQKAEVEAQLNALDAEVATVGQLLQETQEKIVNLHQAWQTGTVQQRQELAFALYSEGLYWSAETKFFEPRNLLLMNAWAEMCDDIFANRLVGVPDGI
jgi:site-specific DNA recombinase